MSKVHITKFNQDDNVLHEKARKLCKQFNEAENDDIKQTLLSEIFNS